MKLLVREIRQNEVEQDITQRDQFNTDAVGLVETLVREALQNSMDGRLREQPSVPVLTRIAIVDPRAEDGEFWSDLLAGIAPHLTACDVRLDGVEFGRPRLLVIEDFGTTGLLGAVDRKDQLNFSDFWRRNGRSHKHGRSAGRWGLGKLVFSSSSRTRTFFGLTVQSTDPTHRRLLMGSAVLKNHRLEGNPPRDIAPHAFFAVENEDGMQIPETSEPVVDAFVAASRLRRSTEPGLSIVVPFVRDEITTEEMVPHIVRNWFFPILTGQLVVEVADLVMDRDSFAERAVRFGGAEFADGRRVGFINELHAARAAAPSAQLAENWGTIGYAPAMSDAAWASLRDDYTAGKLVALRVPISLRPRNRDPESSYVDLYLQSCPETTKGEALYVRGAITIPGEARRFAGRNCFGALVAEHKVIASFLGDAEGPAHTLWSGTAEKLVEGWRNPSARLKEVREALNSFYAIIAQVENRIEPDALIDVFYVNKAGTTKTTKRPNPVSTKVKVPPIPRSPSRFAVSARKGGFAVRGTAHASLPMELTVRAAYDVVDGNPLKLYSSYDFDLANGEIHIDAEGAEVTTKSSNELAISVTSPTFSVAVTGFDGNRDLFVKAEVK